MHAHASAIPCAVGTAAAYPFFIIYYTISAFVLTNVVVGFLLEKMVTITLFN